MDSKLEPNRVPVGLTNAGKGRPKGSKNKINQSAKEAFEFAFDAIGGPERLSQWADANTSDFYKLFARLIPVDNRISGKDGEELKGLIAIPLKDFSGTVAADPKAS